MVGGQTSVFDNFNQQMTFPTTLPQELSAEATRRYFPVTLPLPELLQACCCRLSVHTGENITHGKKKFQHVEYP